MSDNTPYPSTQADPAKTFVAVYQPKFFSTTGRIGRLRYLIYQLGVYILTTVFLLLSIPFGFLIKGSPNIEIIIKLYLAICMIIMLVFSFIFMKRRLNDLNHSGWFSLLTIIPFINSLLWIYLLFFPGIQGENHYGIEPADNPTTLAWTAFILVIIIGLAFAFSFPHLKQMTSL